MTPLSVVWSSVYFFELLNIEYSCCHNLEDIVIASKNFITLTHSGQCDFIDRIIAYRVYLVIISIV